MVEKSFLEVKWCCKELYYQLSCLSDTKHTERRKWNKTGILTSRSRPSSPLEWLADRARSSGCTEDSVPSSWIWSKPAFCCQACCIQSSSIQPCTRPRIVSSGATRHRWSGQMSDENDLSDWGMCHNWIHRTSNSIISLVYVDIINGYSIQH